MLLNVKDVVLYNFVLTVRLVHGDTHLLHGVKTVATSNTVMHWRLCPPRNHDWERLGAYGLVFKDRKKQ